MNTVKWNDRFNIGVDSIDKAHQRLFSIVSKLLTLNEDITKRQHACREGIKYFKSYTFKHFADEEAYMQSINYSGYAIHKSLHDNMRDKTIPALESELESQNYSKESIQHFLGICVGWLNAHIMVEDHAITGRTANKWVHQPSEDEMESLSKAVIQSLQELFRVKASLISHYYSGEDFSDGNTLCYRLTYRFAGGEPLQVYLVYEERMALRFFSEMLGKPIPRTDKAVLHALKVLSQKCMERIGKHFSSTQECQLEKSDFLSFDQLLRIFEKTNPHYSLLFNTGEKGYFALCVNTNKKYL